MNEVQGKKSSVLLVAAAWLVVAAPAAWGLSYTVQNAMKLLTKQPSAAVAPNAR